MTEVHLDFETRSRVDLPACGSYRYAEDPSTAIFMAAVSTNGLHDPVYLWINPLFRDAGVQSDPEALELLASADIVYAHNAPFEQSILWGDKSGNFPFISIDKWRCTAAMARIAGIPDSLEKCGDTLEINARKDKRGKDLIKFFSIPQEDGTFNEPRDHKEKWKAFCDYCRQDVRAEREIHHQLSSGFALKGTNLETFQFTMRMNDLGVPVNVPGLRNAKKIVDSVMAGAEENFRLITGLNITQRGKILEWFKEGGLPLENMQAETLLQLDPKGLDPLVAHALTLYREVSYAATKKIDTMLDWVCADGRLHGVFKFYGAGTGRWSAGGPQIQNAKKPTPAMRPITKQAYKYVCNGGSAEGLRAVYGDPVEVLASCIRHFIHDPNADLLDGDYNAVEARIISWLADDKPILNMWKKGVDLYRFMASRIYDIPITQVTSDQRDFGKRVELGCGYGMGHKKFLATCQQYKVACDAALAERAVNTYRETHAGIVDYWRRLNNYAFNAIANANGVIRGDMYCDDFGGIRFLFIKLPSGRRLAYPHPELTDGEFGREITYWGQMPMSTQWGRVKLYGGKIAENCLGEGTEVLTQRGWVPIETVLPSDLLWDGIEWVTHAGVVDKGDQETISFAGIQLTPDHEVFEGTNKVSAYKSCVSNALKTGLLSWQNLDSNSKAKFTDT